MDKPKKSLKTSSNEIELRAKFSQASPGWLICNEYIIYYIVYIIQVQTWSNFNHIWTLLLNVFTDIWSQRYLAEIELVQGEPESRETFDWLWLQHFACWPPQNFFSTCHDNDSNGNDEDWISKSYWVTKCFQVIKEKVILYE